MGKENLSREMVSEQSLLARGARIASGAAKILAFVLFSKTVYWRAGALSLHVHLRTLSDEATWVT